MNLSVARHYREENRFIRYQKDNRETRENMQHVYLSLDNWNLTLKIDISINWVCVCVCMLLKYYRTLFLSLFISSFRVVESGSKKDDTHTVRSLDLRQSCPARFTIGTGRAEKTWKSRRKIRLKYSSESRLPDLSFTSSVIKQSARFSILSGAREGRICDGPRAVRKHRREMWPLVWLTVILSRALNPRGRPPRNRVYRSLSHLSRVSACGGWFITRERDDCFASQCSLQRFRVYIRSRQNACINCIRTVGESFNQLSFLQSLKRPRAKRLH